MDQRRAQRSIVKLIILIGLAFAYSWLDAGDHRLTGVAWWDGAIAVILGLFICSQPAAYVVDLLYRASFSLAGVPRWVWPALNLLALLAGLSLIFMGTLQLTAGAPRP